MSRNMNNREERLRALDLSYQRARGLLLKEQARTYVNEWCLNFERLARLVDRPDYLRGNDAETIALLIVGVANDCTGFHQTSCRAPQELRPILIPLEEGLAQKIYQIAVQSGYTGRNLEDTITRLARGRKLTPVIDFVKEMSRQLTSP